MINIAEISQNESWRPTVPVALPGSWQLLIQSGARVSEFIQHILKTQKKHTLKGLFHNSLSRVTRNTGNWTQMQTIEAELVQFTDLYTQKIGTKPGKVRHEAKV